MSVYNSNLMKIIVENLVSILETDHEKLKSILEKKYQFKVEGYQYVASYKRGHWDGFKKFFQKTTGKFGTGLLSYIIYDLEVGNIEYEIEDKRKSISKNKAQYFAKESVSAEKNGDLILIERRYALWLRGT